ncbi:hypothetical protein Val02_21600 [Virgisporangium aliadipatigenens]|uniref:Uncharacterized protein n=1 Tax=Virgisporangium aliadipatigenens TaxID=741659 RepID=A0A8J3YHD8_9ACTN|nr:hypothetical protein [Virgisporangium aliadipatigenens]GIJ45274.1 hypothetical protein Val02_21600 [Virgisporangium aliadipatigenens]
MPVETRVSGARDFSSAAVSSKNVFITVSFAAPRGSFMISHMAIAGEERYGVTTSRTQLRYSPRNRRRTGTAARRASVGYRCA